METCLAENLRFKMFEQRIKVPELSRRSGIKEQSIYSILAGTTKSPRLDTVTGLARALGVTVDELAVCRDAEG